MRVTPQLSIRAVVIRRYTCDDRRVAIAIESKELRSLSNIGGVGVHENRHITDETNASFCRV